MWFCNIKGLEQHSRSRLPITIPKVSRSSLKNSNLLVSLCFQALYLRMLAWREGVEQYEVHGSQPGWGFACAELLRVLHLVPATDASPGFRVGAYSWRIGAGFWHASFTQGDNKCTGRHFTALISQRRNLSRYHRAPLQNPYRKSSEERSSNYQDSTCFWV